MDTGRKSTSVATRQPQAQARWELRCDLLLVHGLCTHLLRVAVRKFDGEGHVLRLPDGELSGAQRAVSMFMQDYLRSVPPRGCAGDPHRRTNGDVLPGPALALCAWSARHPYLRKEASLNMTTMEV
jgi:hypothetical protein